MLNAIFLAAVVTSGGKSLGYEPVSYVASGRSNGQRVRIVFRQENFQSRGRRLKWLLVPGTENSGDPPTKGMYRPAYFDGHRWQRFAGEEALRHEDVAHVAVGDWLTRHRTELVGLDVSVNGKRWPVPHRWVEGLLDPDLGPRYVRFEADRQGSWLRVAMFGSDGAAGYRAVWTLRSNGRHSRSFGDVP